MPRALLTQFRVMPDAQRPEYYVIRISPTRTAMYADYRCIKVIENSMADLCDFLAITCPWQRLIIAPDGRETEHPERGAILFFVDGIDAEVVSHEMTHAAVDYLETVEGVDWAQLKNDQALEEYLCRVVGRLTGEFWWKWQAFQRRQARKGQGP